MADHCCQFGLTADANAGAEFGRASQEQTLWKLIHAAGSTPFGQRHRFAEITSVKAFQDSVPLVTLEDTRSKRSAGPGTPLIRRETVAQTERSALVRQLGPNLPTASRESDWLDLRECLNGPSPACDARKGAGFSDRMDQILRDSSSEKIRVVLGPMHWLSGVFTRLEFTDTDLRGRGAFQNPWPQLSLVIGASPGQAAFRVFIEERLAQSRRDIRLLAGYSTRDGALVGLEDPAPDAAYTVLPDAGVFLEFIPVAAGRNPTRLALWEVKREVAYELCISTANGLFACRTGQYLKFVHTGPHRFVALDKNGRTVVDHLASSRRVSSKDRGAGSFETAIGAHLGWGGARRFQC